MKTSKILGISAAMAFAIGGIFSAAAATCTDCEAQYKQCLANGGGKYRCAMEYEGCRYNSSCEG